MNKNLFKNDSKKAGGRILRLLLPIIFWILVWQLVAFIIGKPLLFPGPWETLTCLVGLLSKGAFWISVGKSLLRIICGYAGGIVLGALLFVLSCASKWTSALIDPLVKFIRAVPVASFIVLIMLYSSYGAVPAIVSGLMVGPLVFTNLKAGLKETAAPLVEVAAAYRFGLGKRIKYIYIPSLRPYFAAALVNAAGLAWKSGIAAEVIAKPVSALGNYIYNAKLYLETPTLFASTLVVIALSFGMESLMAWLLTGKGGKTWKIMRL